MTIGSVSSMDSECSPLVRESRDAYRDARRWSIPSGLLVIMVFATPTVRDLYEIVAEWLRLKLGVSLMGGFVSSNVTTFLIGVLSVHTLGTACLALRNCHKTDEAPRICAWLILLNLCALLVAFYCVSFIIDETFFPTPWTDGETF